MPKCRHSILPISRRSETLSSTSDKASESSSSISESARIRREKAVFSSAGVLLLIGVWCVASAVAGPYVIPRPWTTIVDCGSYLLRANSWLQILITVGRVAAGFSAAFIIGTIVGMLSASRRFAALIRPSLVLMQGVPPILWTIPLILVLGFGRVTPILTIALICLPLVAMNVSEGVKTVPKELLEMLSVFAPGRLPRIREVVLPHLAPFLLASLKLGLTLGIKASVVAEYFAANNGVGFQLNIAYQSFQTRKLFAWAVLLVLIIVMFDQVLARLLARFSPQVMRRQETVAPDAGPDVTPGVPASSEPSLRSGEQQDVVLRSVRFAYPDGTAPLSTVDLVAKGNDVLVLSGDSGCGKTTLLKIAAQVLRPASGTVERPRRIGFVFQDDRFLPWRSNLYNVALPLRYQGVDRREAYRIALDMLRQVGLAGHEHALPSELSGGMLKRLSLARCVAGRPQALFMDEPFSGLHRSARTMLWRRIASFHASHPVPTLIVTHFPEEVPAAFGARFYALEGKPAVLRVVE